MLKVITLLVLFFVLMTTPTKIIAKEKTILFIHHSTGGNLIKEGKLRSEIKKIDPSLQLWDHNYNLSPIFTKLLAHNTHLRGLSDNNGTVTGKDYTIVLSNNSPKEYADIFSRNPKDPTLKAILNYDVIAFKNCYPTTKIVSDKQLAEDKRFYISIRNSLKKYPKKQFILFTPPPVRKEVTNTQNAKRAKLLVHWLRSKEFAQNVPNIHIFDFFSLLANNNGFLKQEYTRLLPWDSHPNVHANKTVAPLLATYLFSVASSK
ncbi:MAG: hypothetical protein NUV65_02410 [Candidatus Roizmanbacteria bacterium]|nr:hypothetical protein [Candidatus Roizmanbacteria bacterium]